MSSSSKFVHWFGCVIAVVAVGLVLVALMLPAVQSAREASRRTSLVYDNIPFGEQGLVWQPPDQGRGPGQGGDKFQHLAENDFVAVADEPLSTFAIDVDTASYSKVRSFLMDYGQLPPVDAIRIEELINYFDYDYSGPTGEHPFAANVEVAGCPWNTRHRLARIGIKAAEMEVEQRPASNLVFLLDVSGSMNHPNKLPLLRRGMLMLSRQLTAADRVSIVVYAGATGLVLDSVPGDQRRKVQGALDRLSAGGSTNGGAGIRLAYRLALDNFIDGGTNRVILCTDGDFNVGTTSTGELVRIAGKHAKDGVFLTVLGFGFGNHNDAMLEDISNKANGNYAFIDNVSEARKVLVEELAGTLHTVAKDVKVQIEFNPAKVSAYRLVGYENRLLAARDFNDDQKDAGEIGAGHTVTALYEVVPAGVENPLVQPNIDDLKYQTSRATKEAAGDELLTLKLRYKLPDEDVSRLMSYGVVDAGKGFTDASPDFQFAAGVAMFGMLLRDSKHVAESDFESVTRIVDENVRQPVDPYRTEFLQIVSAARSLK